MGRLLVQKVGPLGPMRWAMVASSWLEVAGCGSCGLQLMVAAGDTWYISTLRLVQWLRGSHPQ